MVVVVEASLFTGKRNVDGDFNWMSKQPHYHDAIFISFENVVDMLTSTEPGGGSACLRDRAFCKSLAKSDEKCSVGIPTGWSRESGGFTVLDNRTRKVIDNAFDRLCRVLQSLASRFTRVIYPCDETDRTQIGTGIFKGSLAATVVEYISMRLEMLPRYVRLFAAPSLTITYSADAELLSHALHIQKIKTLEWELSEARKKRVHPDAMQSIKSLPARQRTMLGYGVGIGKPIMRPFVFPRQP